MLDIIINNTKKYIDTHDKVNRKNKGQFFTPVSIAEFMAVRASGVAEHLSILEPGAGNGMLTAAVIKYCVENDLCKCFDIRFIENDEEVLPVLKETVALIKKFVLAAQGSLDVTISTDNYITSHEEGLYDIVICNPPYKKMRKNSEESAIMEQYVYGQPNLYSLFMCKAINNLKKGGHFVFITPRSWTSGNYYKLARKYLLENLNLSDLLLFENREDIFNNEDVLQETLITAGIKGKNQSQFINIYNADNSFQLDPIQMEVPAHLIKGIGVDEYLLLPMSEEDIQIITKMSRTADTFESLGYIFKTGPVVEFRNKNVIASVQRRGYIPMFRAANIVNGQFVFPANTSKAQYVDITEQKLLVSNRNTVLLRRLSAKEEPRRLQSCVYYQSGDNEYISIENHVNYLVHSNGTPLSIDEVEWINGILTSDDYDIYYRIINGSTQVNAGELNKLPLQRREQSEATRR
ncbi:MAG: hypothetical protein EGP77_01030 [Lachnospiraceae bacterium]|nr:hypothetical protein [Lachnospiraceae bacterium]